MNAELIENLTQRIADLEVRQSAAWKAYEAAENELKESPLQRTRDHLSNAWHAIYQEQSALRLLLSREKALETDKKQLSEAIILDAAAAIESPATA